MKVRRLVLVVVIIVMVFADDGAAGEDLSWTFCNSSITWFRVPRVFNPAAAGVVAVAAAEALVELFYQGRDHFGVS